MRKQVLETICAAINANQVLRVRYHDKVRLLEPYLLGEYSDNRRFLLAWMAQCENDSAKKLVSNMQGFRGLALPWASPRLYALVGIIVLLGVFWLAARTPARAHRYLTAFGLILGGGLGNVIELGVRGAATDFITVGFGAFNLADVWVTAGGMIYLWLRLRDGIRERGVETNDSRIAVIPTDRYCRISYSPSVG